jgi:RHS repeat-associated protein
MSGDTASTIATALKTAINADTNLQNINISATSSSAVVSIATATTTYTESTSGGATETITLGSNSLGNSTAVINGVKTTGDTLTITAHNAQLSGGSEAVTYTVLSGDDLVSIAAGVAAAINADTALQTHGVSASNSNAASLAFSQNFNGNGTLPGGASITDVSTTDAVPNTTTNLFSAQLNSGSGTSLTFDANGNMTTDQAGRTLSYDAENRLISIVYPGSGNHSDFTIDPMGRNVKILEYTASSLTSTKQLVWDFGNTPKEARDNSSAITAQYFALGETISSADHYFTPDRLGLADAMMMASIFPSLKLLEPDFHQEGFNPVSSFGSTREMTNSSGTIDAQLAFDPYGQVTQLQGSVLPDFQYAGYYLHSRSGLNLTLRRVYSPTLARWINRDPIEEDGGVNLYSYVDNDPVSAIDLLGQQAGSFPEGTAPFGNVPICSREGLGEGNGACVCAMGGTPYHPHSHSHSHHHPNPLPQPPLESHPAGPHQPHPPHAPLPWPVSLL